MKTLCATSHQKHLLKISVSQKKVKSMKKLHCVPVTKLSPSNFTKTNFLHM